VYRFRHTRHRAANQEIVDDRKVLPGNVAIPQEFVQRNQTVPASASDALKDQAAAKTAAADAPSFHCQECQKTFRSQQGLKTHIRQVHELRMYEKNRSDVKLKCPFCPREYDDRSALWQHTVNKHSDELERSEGTDGNRPAQISTTSSTEVFRLPEEGGTSHLVRDRPIWKGKAESSEGKPAVCGRCSVPEEYKGMKVRIWEEEGFYACPVCGQSVPLDWSVEEHLETLKPLLGLGAECTICKKKFIEHRALKQHMNYCKRKQKEGLAESKGAPASDGCPSILALALPVALTTAAAFLLYRQASGQLRS